MTSVGEALVAGLVARGVELVFGIPGVHTVELYRGIARAGLRHVTPRHEQGAGFMADGYARVAGKPGVAFVITGPGLTNTLTAMAQARADSVPMLVVSGVNARATLGRGGGELHALPDQGALAATVALASIRVDRPQDLAPALDRAFAAMTSGRPGPVHLEVPTDVMPLACPDPPAPVPPPPPPPPDPARLSEAAARLGAARAPVILAGGGVRDGAALRALAEALDAPVIATVNARGLMHGHPLLVAASPSLPAVRALIARSDLVLALGTELGATDYDMYGDGGLPDLAGMVRVDIDPEQLARHPCRTPILGDAAQALAAWLPRVAPADRGGRTRAAAARAAARAALPLPVRAGVAELEAIRAAVPGAVMVGDSTKVVYAGNLAYDHDRPRGWFNAATGYGTLGYGPGAAIGAALADPAARVLCLVGDGGLQFSLAELGAAAEERLDVSFLVWNNRGYGEIADAMRAAGVPPVGVTPTPPDLAAVAAAFGLPFARVESAAAWGGALGAGRGPRLIERVGL